MEARHLARDPWLAGAGVGLCLLALVLLTIVWRDDNGTAWGEQVALLPWLAHPLTGMALVAAHRATTRTRRDGVEELYASCPLRPEQRTVALLGTAWVPVVFLAVYLGLHLAAIALLTPTVHGSVPVGALGLVPGSLLLGAGGVVLGVALGRWAPQALVPLVAVVAVGFVSLRLVTAGDPGWNPLAPLSTFGLQVDSPVLLGAVPTWAWCAWLVGLGAVVAVIGVARHRHDRTVVTAAALAAAVALLSGLLATRPLGSGEAAALADELARPDRHQGCVAAPAGSRVCTFEGYGELRSRLLAAVTPVLAALPTGAPPITVRQEAGVTTDELPPAVADRLPAGLPGPTAGEVPVASSAGRSAMAEGRLLVALASTGLPIDPTEEGLPMVVAGEARGVVALWLATRGLDARDAHRLASATEHDPVDAFDRGWAWPDGCAAAPVVWSGQDLAAARALIDAPAGVVAGVVVAEWDRWIERTTTTDELLAAAHLAPVGPADPVVARATSTC